MNNDAQERIFGAIIFVTLMLVVSTTMIIALQPVRYIYAEQPTFKTGYNILTDGSMQVWFPKDGYVCNASRIYSTPPDLIISSVLFLYWSVGDEEHLMGEWWEPNTTKETARANNIYLVMVENNTQLNSNAISGKYKYEDYFWFARHTGCWDLYHAFVPYEEFIKNAKGNLSYVRFTLDTDYIAVIYTPIEDPQNESFAEKLYAHNFTIYLGKMYIDVFEDMQKQDFLTIMIELLTFSLPGMHWAIDAIIAIPIWMAIAFIVFTLIERLVPG